MTNPVFRSLAILCLLAGGTATSQAQGRPQTGTLRVVVKDQSGAVIPGAFVQLRGADDDTRAIGRDDLPTDGQGVVVARDLKPGRYAVEVSFPGFEKLSIPDVRVRAGENRREAVLAIQKLDEMVFVGRDAATAASDPKNDRFNTVLSKAQIEALPDDPDEMERVLKDMAGPGATIRMDGFRGGRLPPKSQIRSIRFSRDMFAAENHGGGMVFVDIVTQPGLGPLRGSMDFNYRDDALNARNAFQPSKGPEQTQQYTFNLNGTLIKQRTSFSLSATAASLYDSTNVYAAIPSGAVARPLRRPTDRYNFNGRLDHALTKAHTVRFNFQQNSSDQRNLGVGSYDLPGRAYSRTATDSILRLSENGPIGKSMFADSRLQVRWQSNESASALEAPTVKVLDAFTSGGAQQAGGRDSTEIEFATTVDWARGKHAVRMGTLVEGGRYTSDSRTNYLGTFTFASLADFDAGKPASWSQRVGNPLVEYSHWQAGLFVQDDWRIRKNLTLSGGLRQEMQTHLDSKVNLSPRAGFTWSPFKSGKTTVRGGGGIFYDWLDANTYEQPLRVDGVRQQDLIISNPGYPDPYSAGTAGQTPPPSRYMLAPGLNMPRRTMVNVGIAQQISPRLGANLGYTHSEGNRRLRGRNINAPTAAGVRPDPSFGNITQVESTALARGDSLNAGFNFTIPERRTFLFANYTWMRQRNDADGAFSLPANSYDLTGEWGPASGSATHNFSAMVSTTLPRNIRLALSGLARSGSPYNVTTGRDDNGDTVFNDRPAGVGRNSAMSAGMWDISSRVSYAFGFGNRPRSTDGPMGGGQMVVVHGGGAGAGDMLGGLMGGGAEDKRLRIEIFASASNLFNHVNAIGFSGVMTSPFFGQPTAAMAARKIDLGVRLGF